MSTAHKLTAIKFNVPDEWIGTLLLAGLPDEYKPMIMGLESSGIQISSDSIKTKLLQDVKASTNGKTRDDDSALYSKYRNPKKNQKSPVRCFACNKLGHFASNCRTNKPDTTRKTDKDKAFYVLFTNDSPKPRKKSWYIDSCASAHMTYEESNLNVTEQLIEDQRSVIAADGSKMSVKSIGNVTIPINIHNKKDEVTANGVLHVPDITTNLLSISKIVQKGNEVIFDQKGCRITKNKRIIATASEENGIYKLDTNEENHKDEAMLSITSQDEGKLWHLRLGHMNRSSMEYMKKNEMVTGLKFKECSKETCITCVKGKHSRTPFKPSGKRSKELLGLVHSDLCGPMDTESIGGARYFLTLIDDYSRKATTFPLRNKSEVTSTFDEYKREVENQTGKSIKILRTDNGKEYVNQELKRILTKSGIKHQLTIDYTPQQNGLAERFNRTLVEKARCMLAGGNLPKKYWAEAIATATHLYNISPTKAIPEKTPMEMWSGEKPDVSHLRVFGCQAMVHIPKEKRRKLDLKSRKCIFLGYLENSKGYRLIDPSTNKILRSRDVIFLEEKFLKTEGKDGTDDEKKTSEENSTIPAPFEEQEKDTLENENSDRRDEQKEEEEEFFSPTNEETEFRYSFRTPKPKRDPDFIYYSPTFSPNDPSTVEEAMNGPNKNFWKAAMKDEINSLMENNTWKLVDPPPDKRILESKWVFKTKKNPDGNTERFKARLVAKGFLQKEGIEEVFSPVVRYDSIRYLLGLAVKYDLIIHHMDVTCAYLNGVPEAQHQVCKLIKTIYGLKQSGKAWNQKLDAALSEMGLTKSPTDECVYFIKTNETLIIIAIYVDDFLMLSNNLEELDHIKKQLKARFKMKDLGKVKQILGMNIDRRNDGIRVSQTNYIEKILEKFNMSECKPVQTPSDPHVKLTNESSPKTPEEIEDMKNVPYMEAVGSLVYLAQSARPDIAYATGAVSRFCTNPGRAHWSAVHRILRYLQGSKNKHLHFKKEENNNFPFGYTDADWANETNNRFSITGYVFMFQNGPVTWSTKKQKTVALSTTEAEYLSLSSASQEALWLRSLCFDLDPEAQSQPPTIILCDNKGAIDLATKSNFSQRTKHIDVRHHFLRECVENKKIEISFTSSEEMVADCLTKPLPGPKFDFCTKSMGIH